MLQIYWKSSYIHDKGTVFSMQKALQVSKISTEKSFKMLINA